MASDTAAQLENPILNRFVTGYFIGESNAETGDGRGEFDELVFFYEPKSEDFVAGLAAKYDGEF